MILNNDWEQQAIALDSTGTMSKRDISKMLKVPKSTVSDMLRKYYGTLAATNEPEVIKQKDLPTHLVIFDTQVRPEVPTDYLDWIGQYIARKQPDVIMHLADHADMPSLSSWDKGKRAAENKRVKIDIDAAIEGMRVLLAPMRALQARQREAGEPVYNPRMIITLGNHEDRITRYVNANPELHGFLSIDDLKYEEFGWEVIPFLTPIEVDGIHYCHYFPNVMTGKALGGTAANMLTKIGTSFTMGHRQLLDVAVRTLQTTGQQQWGVICGSSYVHDEDYKGVQGNKHWRGIMVKHNVRDGSYDPLMISMDWLRQEYGNV